MTIALLTDFGTKDYFIGAMKGVILSINNAAYIIDITHETPPQNIRSAAFTLNACYRDFPLGTIFVAVVDPGVGSSRRAILVKSEDYFFVAPDNGILSFIFAEEKEFSVFEITNENFFKDPVSKTFHGRDIFSPVAAHLSNGISANEFGDRIFDFVTDEISEPKSVGDKTFIGNVLHIDYFGNLITNFRVKDLPSDFSISINDHKIDNFYEYFAKAEVGEVFAVRGSADFLEIVARDRSAQEMIDAAIGDEVILKF